VHVLLRFVELKKSDDRSAVATSAQHFVPAVSDALTYAAEALANGETLDRERFRSIAREILSSCALRAYVVTERAWTRTLAELATHATNVAMISGAIAIESRLPDVHCVDVVAAALLHDIGHLLLPTDIRGLPDPLVEEKNKALFRNHTFAGASALLTAGAPPLWVAAALEHHRGVDGRGYPTLESPPPHELVRVISIANFFDRKRTLLEGRALSSEEVLREASELAEAYFGRAVLEQFTRALGIFPPGTTVELSDRQPALVVSANPGDPWRPRVLVLRGPDANKRIDLRELDPNRARHQLSIVRAIPPPLLLRSEIHAEQGESEATSLEAPPPPLVTPRSAPPPERDPRPMSDLLDHLAAPREPLVTSPPPMRSAPPVSRSSRPIIVQEIVTLPPRGYSDVPRNRTSPIPPVPKITIPPLVVPKPPKIEEHVAAPRELSLSSIVRRTGAPPAGLDHRGAFVLGFVDGGSSLVDLLDMSGLPKADLLRIVGELIDSGAVALD
jgi:HD-GYP domain-containing protein (c-di-GMP phosphodiesterase class II)